MYSNSGQYNSMVEDMSQLNMSSSSLHSPGGTRKLAPTVPPKPKKGQEGSSGIYGNLPADSGLSRTELQDYYAMNAPTPGNVGVATARQHRPAGELPPPPPPPHSTSQSREHAPLESLPRGEPQMMMASSTPASQEANCDPLAPGKMGRTDSRVYNPDATPPSHYTPPPPQPARSYTPTSKMAVHMGAAQPLYSNTSRPPSQQQQQRVSQGGHHHSYQTQSHQQQPLYSNQQQNHQQAVYSNVVQHRNGSNDAVLSQQHQAAQHQLYANVAPRNGAAYASYGADSDFPLPPPEVLPPSSTVGDDDPHHPHHHHQYPAPASPVSSAYSELRRANPPRQAAPPHHLQQHHLGAGGYAAGNNYGPPASHASTAYESLYEPISPRPASQMSATRSGGYGPVYGGSSSGGPYTAAPGGGGQGKEAEVDALTSMLVQSMESSGDPEFFGICARCGGKVVGEGSGCTAMDQVFHIRCFDCIVCHLQLQGKPFYAVDSKPYCEDCYMNTLEKCCVCTKPILERILRATGKPYHPGCFTCVVCSQPLDGIPFTVDAANQIHCIDDFHKKFAPRCSVCQEPIMPEPGLEETVRVVALDRSFHINCYKCEDCGLLLSSEAEGRGCYPLDGHVLCKSCNAARVQALSSTLATNI